MTSTRRGRWMQTYTGLAYWPLDPRAEEVRIEDIAHHLSMLCRYTGACKNFYSVAEHSIHVSYLVPPVYAFQGLMHDAPEAYLGDMGRPLKHTPEMVEYRRIEALNWQVIAPVFGLPIEKHESVDEMDSRMCVTEKVANMGPSPLEWEPLGEPADIKIKCWSPKKAEHLFLARFCELVSKVGVGQHACGTARTGETKSKLYDAKKDQCVQNESKKQQRPLSA